jgi:hypothetical protein
MERLSYVCSHVFGNERPILLICHDVDGDWQFLCGDIHENEIPVVVGMEHLLERDPSLIDLREIPPGWGAERINKTSKWIVKEMFD